MLHIAPMLAVSLAPITDPIYSHLPGGSFFGFIASLPGSSTVAPILLGLPGADSLLSLLGQYGITG